MGGKCSCVHPFPGGAMKDRIRQARDMAGLSQGQLARLLGCSRQLVTQWESGETGADGWADRIAEALEVSPGWLRAGKPEEEVDVGAIPGAARLAVEDRAKVQALLDMLPRVAHE